MLQRIIGVLKLDVNTFEEIEHDESATTQAAIIIAVIAILQAIGGYFAAGTAAGALEQFGTQMEGMGELVQAASQISPIGSAIQAFIGLFISWVLWSALTFFIGTRLFAGKATMGEMLRVIGFAMVPQILGVVPCLGLIGWIYSLVTGFIGIRQGLDLDNSKTAMTVGISFLVAIFINLCVLGPVFAAIL